MKERMPGVGVRCIKLTDARRRQHLQKTHRIYLSWSKVQLYSSFKTSTYKFSLPWDSFLPWILLKCKKGTCNYNTTKVKYHKFRHFNESVWQQKSAVASPTNAGSKFCEQTLGHVRNIALSRPQEERALWTRDLQQNGRRLIFRRSRWKTVVLQSEI